jgi:hypothetical protein
MNNTKQNLWRAARQLHRDLERELTRAKVRTDLPVAHWLSALADAQHRIKVSLEQLEAYEDTQDENAWAIAAHAADELLVQQDFDCDRVLQ